MQLCIMLAREPLLLVNCPILIYFFKFEITAWLWPCLMHLSVFDVTFIHMHLLKFIGFSHNSVYFFFSSLKSFIHVHLKIRTKFKSNSYTTIKSHSYKCTSFLTQFNIKIETAVIENPLYKFVFFWCTFSWLNRK